jgi:hypothetical protein
VSLVCEHLMRTMSGASSFLPSNYLRVERDARPKQNSVEKQRKKTPLVW